MSAGASSFEEVLEKDGRLVYTTRGFSMRPMLRQNRDIVVIEPAKERLKKYDVALYHRNGKYVLHRIIKVNESDYTARGDNNCFKECGIRDADVLGVLTEFVRDGKKHSVSEPGYRLYARLRNASYPLRWLRFHTKKLIKRVLARFGIRVGHGQDAK
ncbi:MAG: S24/S26 family peptidase [Clostridia bacterium]|nr:S24/S26 family peptidase [Clostridia bacterium]